MHGSAARTATDPPATGDRSGARMARWLAVSAAAFAPLAFAVSDQRHLWGEVAVLEAANDLSPAVGWPLRLVMQLGTLGAALAVVALVAWRTRRHGRAPALAALVAVLVAFRLDDAVKHVVARPRPPGVVPGLHVREVIGGYGFPSGHTAVAFALAASIHPLLPPRRRWVLWALAAVVGLARLHVGVHWPADVAGGAALGTAIGATAWLLVERLPLGPRRADAGRGPG